MGIKIDTSLNPWTVIFFSGSCQPPDQKRVGTHDSETGSEVENWRVCFGQKEHFWTRDHRVDGGDGQSWEGEERDQLGFAEKHWRNQRKDSRADCCKDRSEANFWVKSNFESWTLALCKSVM